jgi:hypothetical protein
MATPAVRGVWLGIGSLLTVAAVGFGTIQAVSALAHDEHTETETFAADGIALLDVENDGGSVEVSGGDVDEITVVSEVSDGLFATSRRVEVAGSTLVVRADCPQLSTWCSVDHRIVVPRDLDVLVHVDNGRLTVRDLAGDLEADGDNGRIELIRLSGDVVASTDNGRLTATGMRGENVRVDSDNGRVSVTFAEPPVDVRATSNNGSVEVIVPDTEAAYRVEVDTSHGSRDVGIRTDPASDRSIVAETDNGSVAVRYPSG